MSGTHAAARNPRRQWQCRQAPRARTIDAGCVECRLASSREHDARNREERRRKNRDRKRVKYQDSEARVERLDKLRAWRRQRGEPKPISLVAHEGTNEVNEARRWVREQARRLDVTMEFITDGIRNAWTLVEVEKMPRNDAEQLADHVREHRREDGFTRWEDFNPVLNVE